MSRTVPAALALALSVTAFGCVTPPDYSAFRDRPPRSILVLPPVNESVAVDATYSWLTTATAPIAETGYYVFPVAMVDAFMQDNGLPSPAEMHEVDVAKLGEVFGTDAVLYVTIMEWGQKYVVISSATVVHVKAALVDVATGTQLWEWEQVVQEGSGGSGDLVADMVVAVIEQVADTITDQTHGVSSRANYMLFKNEQTGLPYGPYHPKHETDPRLQ
jgi:hypothetical protein